MKRMMVLLFVAMFAVSGTAFAKGGDDKAYKTGAAAAMEACHDAEREVGLMAKDPVTGQEFEITENTPHFEKDGRHCYFQNDANKSKFKEMKKGSAAGAASMPK
ncbi:hypothetical protein K8I61_08825 [bacterium]|nr:hypothetical protein [bacterium]